MPQPSAADRLEAYRRRVLAERDGLVAALATPRQVMDRTLAGLLEANVGTVFGLEHDFKSIRNWRDYRLAVPIRDYETFAPWINRAAGGERNVLSAEDPVLFFMSSGSTGDSKKIPVTAKFMRAGFFPPFYAAWANFVEHFPDVIADDASTLNLKYDPVHRTSVTASGRPHLGASQVDFGTAFGEPLSAEPGSRAPWGELPVPVRDTDYLKKAYLRLRMAVEHDVRCVIGINPAVVAALPYQLGQWWPRIVRELRDGTVAGCRYGWPNVERARELDRLADYFGTLRPAHVWPNFRLIFCWTTGLASLYLPSLAEDFGPGVTVLPAPVAASEGFVAVGTDRHAAACTPALTAAFHEFADADAELRPDTETVSFAELETDHEYHVILSHVGGLYRYALGDVVRVIDRRDGMPRVSYAGRRGLSDVAGERLRESHVVRALRMALDAGGLRVRNATCRPVTSGDAPRYEFALAPSQPVSATEAEALVSSLDGALRGLSRDYDAARAQGRLGKPRLHLLPVNAFLREWQERVESGVRPPQVKDRVFQQDNATWRTLLASAADPAHGEGTDDHDFATRF
jgi:hypothetical protein